MNTLEEDGYLTFADAARNASAYFKNRVQNAKYREDPVLWAKERLGIHLWSKQRKVARAVVKNRKVAVKSGHGIGKSYLAAVLVVWWIDTHIGEDVQVITTAPTAAQVTGIIWEYVRKMHRDMSEKAKEDPTIAPFVGAINEQAQWKDDNRAIIAFGTKPADGNNSGFSGRHYDYTLVLLDEACAVPEGLFMSAETVTTADDSETANNRILAIGNPVDPNTPFGNIFLGNGGKGLNDWDKHTISTLDNPNFTNERDKVPAKARNSLTGVAMVEGWKKKWGTDSNDYKVRVLGEFPNSSDDSMFPVPLLWKTINNSIAPREGVRGKLGVDVSRFGSDKTAVVLNLDGMAQILDVWTDPGDQTNDGYYVAQKVHDLAVLHNVCEVRLDVIGVGSSVFDRLVELSENYDYVVIGMNGSASPANFREHLNARAQWHDHLRNLMVTGRISLPDTVHDPDAEMLFDELREIRKRYNNQHRNLQIESKDEMKKRGVASPNISDALVYAFADLDMNDPTFGMDPGEQFTTDPWEMIDDYTRNMISTAADSW